VISGKTVEEVAELGDGRTKESQRAQSAAS
jgi:hypothetical protein